MILGVFDDCQCDITSWTEWLALERIHSVIVILLYGSGDQIIIHYGFAPSLWWHDLITKLKQQKNVIAKLIRDNAEPYLQNAQDKDWNSFGR